MHIKALKHMVIAHRKRSAASKQKDRMRAKFKRQVQRAVFRTQITCDCSLSTDVNVIGVQCRYERGI